MANKKTGGSADVPIGLSLIIIVIIACFGYELHNRWEKTITPEKKAEISAYQEYRKLPKEIRKDIKNLSDYKKVSTAQGQEALRLYQAYQKLSQSEKEDLHNISAYKKVATKEGQEAVKYYLAYEKLPQATKDDLAAADKMPLYGKKYYSHLEDPDANEVAMAFFRAGAKSSTKDQANYILIQKEAGGVFSRHNITEIYDHNNCEIIVLDHGSESFSSDLDDFMKSLFEQNKADIVRGVKEEEKPAPEKASPTKAQEPSKPAVKEESKPVPEPKPIPKTAPASKQTTPRPKATNNQLVAL